MHQPSPPRPLAHTILDAVRASGLSRSMLNVAIGRGELRARKMRRADIDPRHRLAGILASPSGVPRRGHTHARRVTPTPARPATQITFHDGASMRAVNAARPPVGGSQTRGLENSGRAGGHNRMHNTAVPTTPATVAAHHDRAWWRIEARRVGSDWPAVLVLHAEVVTAWRARHDAGGAP